MIYIVNSGKLVLSLTVIPVLKSDPNHLFKTADILQVGLTDNTILR